MNSGRPDKPNSQKRQQKTRNRIFEIFKIAFSGLPHGFKCRSAPKRQASKEADDNYGIKCPSLLRRLSPING